MRLHTGCTDTVRKSAPKVGQKIATLHGAIEPAPAVQRSNTLPTELHPHPWIGKACRKLETERHWKSLGLKKTAVSSRQRGIELPRKGAGGRKSEWPARPPRSKLFARPKCSWIDTSRIRPYSRQQSCRN